MSWLQAGYQQFALAMDCHICTGQFISERSPLLVTASVFWDCHGKIPWTKELINYRNWFLTVLAAENSIVKTLAESVPRGGPHCHRWRLLFTASCCRMCMGSSAGSFLGHGSHSWGLCPHDLITSQIASPPNRTTVFIGFQTMNIQTLPLIQHVSIFTCQPHHRIAHPAVVWG